jgi:hypothetical protein
MLSKRRKRNVMQRRNAKKKTKKKISRQRWNRKGSADSKKKMQT